MGAPDLLRHLTSRGASVTLKPNGNILVDPAAVLTDADRAEIRTHKPELVALLQRQQKPARQPAPVSEIPPNVLALCGMSEEEIGRMSRRVISIKRAGYSIDDAEVIADRLLLRDRTGLDMSACVECDRLLGRRCTARPAQSFDPRDMHELRRCPAFVPTTN